jgi:hypothetical protein
MKYLKDWLVFESKSSIKFVKQKKKSGAKTDTYNVIKSGNVIGQIKWSSRMRGYAFLPEKEHDTEIKDFIKSLMSDRRKVLESYSSYEEFEYYVMDYLKKYNIFQSQMNHFLDFYHDIIQSAYDDGRQPLSVAEEIAKELKLSVVGLRQYKMDGTNRSQAITYL